MRYTFFLLFLIAFSFSSLSQENDRPTQKQIEAQMQQAIAQAKKQRDETKNKLAQAKANNEDPESIKQKEKMLASMDQMIAMLEKTDLTGNKTSKTLPASEKKEPAYVSPFTPIKLNKPVNTPTGAQARDQLLWYSGRRIDANTLVTPSGLIVRYDRQTNTIIFQPSRQGPGPDTIYYSLLATLQRIRPMQKNYAFRMDNMLNSFFMFPEIESAYKEYDLFKDRHYDLAKNTVKIETQRPDIDIEIKAQNLMDYMNHLPPLQTTMPPKRPNDLCLCDNPTAKDQYKSDLNDWLVNFYSVEKNIRKKVIDYYRHMDLYRQSGRSYTAPIDQTELAEYISKMFDRMKQKLEELSKNYEQGDVLVEDALVLASMDVNQSLNLMAVPDETTKSAIKSLIQKIKELVESNIFETYIENQKSSYNYNAVFDYGLYVSHELNKAAFTGKYVNQDIFQKWMEGLKIYNRFQLRITLDFHYQLASQSGQATMYANGVLESEGQIVVGLGRKDCHWELYLADVDHRNRETSGEEFKITMKVLSGEKDYLNDRKPPFPYSGPTNLKMVFPGFKINFCGGESEAKMDIVSYTPGDAKTHVNDDIKSMYTMDILAYVNKVLLSIKKTEVNVDQLISTAGEMMNMNNSQLPVSSRDPALQQMERLYLKNKKKSELQYRLSQVSHTGRTVIKLTKRNSLLSGMMFNPSVDVADPNDEDRKMGIMLTKGIVSISILNARQH